MNVGSYVYTVYCGYIELTFKRHILMPIPRGKGHILWPLA